GPGGPRHGIGKIGIPESGLRKPGVRDPQEWTVMRKHPLIGAQIVAPFDFFTGGALMIRHHHERYDGTGYPDGLAGDEIPLGARIILVADAFDSMLTRRVYRPARPIEEALEELRDNSGTQFCPRCVSALEAAIASGQVSAPAVAAVV